MSKIELLGALEAKKLTIEKWKQYCGTPCTMYIVYLYSKLSWLYQNVYILIITPPNMITPLPADMFDGLG